ncbi:MAG: hypothetical protein L0241_30135 [Planctomycetia bacterium]|nr:hypothetical protein [Planctomycetia bacterium]
MVKELNTPHPQPQRSARNDTDMRDGDSAHGNPYEPAGDEQNVDSDTDISDTMTRDEALEDMTDALTELESEATPAAAPAFEPGLEVPIAEYDELTIPDVLEKANGLSKDELSRVAEYERAHRNRKTLLAKLERLIKASDAA